MQLDHDAARLWAEHGASWSDFVAVASRRRLASLWTGVNVMIDRKLLHLRHLALAIAALVVSTVFIGVAVLPAALGLHGAV